MLIVGVAGQNVAAQCDEGYLAIKEARSASVVEGQRAVYVLERYSDEAGDTVKTNGELRVHVIAQIIVIPDELDDSQDVIIEELGYIVKFEDGQGTANFAANTEDANPGSGVASCRHPDRDEAAGEYCDLWANTTTPTISLTRVMHPSFYNFLLRFGYVPGPRLKDYCILETDRTPVTYYETDSYPFLVTIVDNDALGPPAVSLAIDSNVALGGIMEPEDIVVTLTRARSVGELEVNVTVSETGDMIAGDQEGARQIIFPNGETSVELRIPTVEDEDPEDDSVVTVRLDEGVGYSLGTATVVDVRVADDDTPFIQVRRVVAAVDEGQDAEFRFVRSKSRGQLTVNINVSETEDAVAAEEEGMRTVVFRPGRYYFELSVPTVDDDERERDSVVTVELREPVPGGDNYDIDAPSTATVTVNDNEEGPLPQRGVSIRADRTPVTEGEDVRFVLRRWPPLNAVDVTVAVSESGAVIDTSPPESREDEDEEGEVIEPCLHTECAVEFKLGATTTMLVLRTVDDEFDEPDSVVTARVLPGTGYDVDPVKTASVTVVDDDLGSRADIAYLHTEIGSDQRLVIVNTGATDALVELVGFYSEEGTSVVERGDGFSRTVPAGGRIVIDVSDNVRILGRRRRTAATLLIRTHPSLVHVMTIDRHAYGEETTLYKIRPE